MIENVELPVGFALELAKHSDIMTQFARLPEQKRNAIVEGARHITSKNGMRQYVENLFGEEISSKINQ
ncbi:MAG: hypothetical protein K2N63_17140 [Lachnospiraceae bacterium]|nr:hypothetical protein [Lachnospiraceae bacterium]